MSQSNIQIIINCIRVKWCVVKLISRFEQNPLTVYFTQYAWRCESKDNGINILLQSTHIVSMLRMYLICPNTGIFSTSNSLSKSGLTVSGSEALGSCTSNYNNHCVNISWIQKEVDFLFITSCLVMPPLLMSSCHYKYIPNWFNVNLSGQRQLKVMSLWFMSTCLNQDNPNTM